MQIEIYSMLYDNDSLIIKLEAVCDSFSSLLWDIEFYKCGSFEVYISATPQNMEIFQTGRIVGRDDDKEHFGIIESVKIETDTENGNYLTVSGRFLMCLLERRIIYPTLNFTSLTSYSDIVRTALQENVINTGNRAVPSLSLGYVYGNCWNKQTKLQVSYQNLMEWIYTICETIGGTANIRLNKISGEQYEMVFDLSEGTDRSVMQSENPHIIFSDAYSNLLYFSYASDSSVQRNFAYILGQGEGEERRRTTYFNGDEPVLLDRYEIYVDAKDISGENQQTENPDDDTGGSEPVISSDNKFIHILCDTSLMGTIIECDFKVLSEESQNVCFSGDLILYSESLRNVEIRYFFDDTEINFTPKISVNGYSTQHLNTFLIAESGEHNFKAVIDSDVAEQVQGRIIGQNIKLVESKPTTADDYVYIIENDSVKLIFYKGTETRIQIPSEIEGKPVTEIESTCFTNSNVKYAVIPETVEKIY